MKVLYVCADRGIPLLGGKGASVHVRAVTSAMQALGHRVTLAVRWVDSGNMAPAVHRIEQLEDDIEAGTRQLADLIVEERIDVVIERYSLQSGAARRATRRHGLPLTLEVNAPLVEEATRYRRLADPNAQAWEHETLRAADRIHVVSSTLLRYVRSVAPGVPAEWIPNGSHVAAFRAAEPLTAPGLDGRLVVGFAGSMKPWHGVADLLNAFARTSAPRSEPEPVLLLVGDGPEQEALRRRATASDLDGRVVFTGAQPHDAIPAHVRRFDVAVAPYRPMPNFYFHPLKIVEYLAAGVPVVYPDQGDLRELVGAAGLAYPPGARDHLAERLTHLMNNHVLRRDLAKAAERRGAEFDWQHIAERVLELARVPDSVEQPIGGSGTSSFRHLLSGKTTVDNREGAIK
jgi:glycosyltransferase involved in cell wall biosynthesis